MTTAATFSFTSSYLLSYPNLRLFPFRRLPCLHISTSTSFSSSPTDLKISFASSPTKTLVPYPFPQDPSGAPVSITIPCIFRDRDGCFRLHATPPPGFVQATSGPKHSPVKKDTNTKKKTCLDSSPPLKYSKASRRFYNHNFKEPQRLSKVLAAAGVASRRSSEELIFEGKVTVNGSLCTSPQTRVDISKDSIYVKGNRLSKRLPRKFYFALNKPKGYICSNGEEYKSVVSLIDDYWTSWSKANPGIPRPRLFTVGRLDVATTGLIIITNDGEFAQRISHPSSNFTKEYIASIEGVVHRRHLIAISKGTEVDGVHCVPDSVELLSAQADVPRPRLRIVVHEGRNHEVRELIRNSGLQLHSLKRMRLGAFRLPLNLGLGKYVELKEADLQVLDGQIQSNSI